VIPPLWPAAGPGTRWFLRLPNWIGDAVMVLPALRALPGGEWIGAAHPRVVPLYAAAGLFTELLPARGARAPLELRERLRRFAPDRALVFTEAVSGAAAARASGARLRLGRGGRAHRTLLTHRLPRGRRDRPLWREYLELAEAAGGRAGETPDFRIPPGAEASARAETLLAPLAGRPAVALAPGASYGPAKQWPLERFEDLAGRLARRDVGTVVVGGRGERGDGARLARAGALDLTGRTDLLTAVAVLARAAATVTNDSGALHLARAAGVPVVAVFGSSSPLWTGPEPGEGEAIWLGLTCSPCFRRRCPLAGDDRLRCLLDVPVERVLEAVDARLETVR
jgi:heptosyltransferase-2